MARNTNLNVAPGGGGGGGAPRAVRTVKISPSLTVKAPYGGKPFTPAEVARLKSITEVIRPTSKATAKVNAKALKASGVVKPKTDTKTNNYTFPKNSLEIKEVKSTARADARAAVAERKAAAQKKAEEIARKEYMRKNY